MAEPILPVTRLPWSDDSERALLAKTLSGEFRRVADYINMPTTDTVTVTGAAISLRNARAILFGVRILALSGGGTINLRLQWQEPSTSTWLNLAQNTTAISSAGDHVVYAGLGVGNISVPTMTPGAFSFGCILPAQIRMHIALGTAFASGGYQARIGYELF